jgi:hypothetical protein
VKSVALKLLVLVVLIGTAASLGWAIFKRLQKQSMPQRLGKGQRVALVAVAPNS